MAVLKDQEVAERLQRHDSSCENHARCSCDREERVHNTFLILKMIRHRERRACEEISRECGGARASDRMRDRDNDTD